MNWKGQLRAEAAEIVSFFVEPSRGLPIALFRIGYGTLAVWTSAFLFPNAVRYFTDAGRLPWGKVKHFPEHIYSVLSFAPTSQTLVFACCVASLLASLMVALGVFARFGALVIFAVHTALQHRNPYILNSGDHLFLICSFLLIFADSDRRLSLRQLFWRAFSSARARALAEPRPAWATRLIGLQICYVYLFAFMAKVNSDVWRSGTAMYDVFASPSLARWPQEIHAPLLLGAITYGTLAFELVFPLLVWQKPFRKWLIMGGTLFHLGIEITMVLPMFSILMILSYATFLDDDEVEWLLSPSQWLSVLRAKKKGLAE